MARSVRACSSLAELEARVNTPEIEPELPEQQRVRQADRTASRVIEGKAVVITIDSNRLHVLNPVGSRVWELSDGRSLSELVDAVVAEFEVERPRAALDVRTFVRELLQMGALEPIAAAGPTEQA